MLDPLILRIISIGFAMLFISAALHKFSDRAQFAAILKDYQILPLGFLPPVSWFIPVVELGVGMAWLVSGLPFIAAAVLALVSTGLLGLYAFAIGINLVRGRKYIDCGCHFASSFKKTEKPGSGQLLSLALVLRNCFLMLAASITLLPIGNRELGLVDYFSLITATLAVLLIFGAFNQLMTNNSAINTWRKSHG
jgi:hypothetical protein